MHLITVRYSMIFDDIPGSAVLAVASAMAAMEAPMVLQAIPAA